MVQMNRPLMQFFGCRRGCGTVGILVASKSGIRIPTIDHNTPKLISIVEIRIAKSLEKIVLEIKLLVVGLNDVANFGLSVLSQ